MMVLETRIIEYLRNKQDWVSKRDFVVLAKLHDVSYYDMVDSLNKITKRVNIGVVYEDGQTKYRWYDLTDEEERALLQAKKVFNEL